MSPKVFTPEERAAMDAADKALYVRFMARDADAERELVAKINAAAFKVAKQLWPKLVPIWVEFRGALFELLWRWREDGLLRPDEPVVFLAQRLLKQEGRKRGVEAHRDLINRSLSEGWEERGNKQLAARRRGLEKRISRDAGRKDDNPEKIAAAREELAWLASAIERLGLFERETFEGEVAVAYGEYATLAEALGVSEGNARVRRHRMRVALAELARQDRMHELVERLSLRGPGASKPRQEASDG